MRNWEKIGTLAEGGSNDVEALFAISSFKARTSEYYVKNELSQKHALLPNEVTWNYNGPQGVVCSQLACFGYPSLYLRDRQSDAQLCRSKSVPRP